MYKLVLVRHGESTWNKENRFTGWTDVGLSEKGVQEAIAGGKLLREAGYVFDIAYTSVLKRAIKTLWLVMEELDQMWIPVINTWRLNERHYGALQGLNKAETAERHGDEQVHIWRRSYDIPPPPMADDDPRHPLPGVHVGAPRGRPGAHLRITHRAQSERGTAAAPAVPHHAFCRIGAVAPPRHRLSARTPSSVAPPPRGGRGRAR